MTERSERKTGLCFSVEGFPYQLFDGYDEFEMNNSLDFSALFMV